MDIDLLLTLAVVAAAGIALVCKFMPSKQKKSAEIVQIKRQGSR